MALQGQLFLHSSSQHSMPARSLNLALKASKSTHAFATNLPRTAWQEKLYGCCSCILALPRQLLLQSGQQASTLPAYFHHTAFLLTCSAEEGFQGQNEHQNKAFTP
jgi:hypothetical protein